MLANPSDPVAYRSQALTKFSLYVASNVAAETGTTAKNVALH